MTPQQKPTLVFASEPLSREALVALASRPEHQSLVELRLLDVGLDDDKACAFAAACRLGKLEALYLPWNRLSARGLEAILRAPALAGLKTLNLYRNQLGPEGMEVLAAHAPALESLNVCFNGLGPSGAKALAGAGQLRLETLHIGINALGDEGVTALAAWSGLRGVRELNARANGLGAASLGALAAGAGWGALQRLLVEDNAFGPAGAEALFRAPPTGLAAVQLGDAGIGADGARCLARAPALRRVKALTLWGNALGDDGVDALLAAEFAPALEELDLSHSEVGARGAACLASTARLERLRRLRARGNPLGPIGRAALTRAATERAFEFDAGPAE